MTFAAQMRVGSLEILAAFGAFTYLASTQGARGLRGRETQPATAVLEVGENGTVRRLNVTLPFVLGRSSNVDVPLLDGLVSRRHACVEMEDGIPFVTDLGSSNGTYLNGERLHESVELRSGDSIRIGNATVRFLGTRTAWT